MVGAFVIGLLSLLIICLSAYERVQETEGKSILDIYESLSEVNVISNPQEIDDFTLENTFKINQVGLVEEYAGEISNTMSDGGLNLVIRAKEGKPQKSNAPWKPIAPASWPF